jgi:uncharacterized ferritin-like protein (DUF455 family)
MRASQFPHFNRPTMKLTEADIPDGAELRCQALALLVERDSLRKAEGTRALRQAWQQGRVVLRAEASIADAAMITEDIPGRPPKPMLVPPREVKQRSMASTEGRAALIHALAHIEFNAINLALDAIWRYAGMPHDFYVDWLKVADEEALHFMLLSSHLKSLGFAYGDFNAHNSLWEMADKTAHDLLARMALVPRTLEARGLDATPGVRNKLSQVGDMKAAEILDIILRDEIGHVEIGNRWYRWLCERQGVEPLSTYRELALRHKAPSLKGPFNREARRQAGFTEHELAELRDD